jgi:hypothetical protein
MTVLESECIDARQLMQHKVSALPAPGWRCTSTLDDVAAESAMESKLQRCSLRAEPATTGTEAMRPLVKMDVLLAG